MTTILIFKFQTTKEKHTMLAGMSKVTASLCLLAALLPAGQPAVTVNLGKNGLQGALSI